MAQESITSRWTALVAVVVVLAGWASDVGARSVHTDSRQYIVGGTDEWDVPVPGAQGNYLEAWAKRVTVAEGDTLVFSYNPLYAHNVLKVTEADYKTCNASSPLLTSTSGADVLTVTAGSNYFICGTLEHCRSGQKVAVHNRAHKLAQHLVLKKALQRRRQLAVLAPAPERAPHPSPGNGDPTPPPPPPTRTPPTLTPSSSSSKVGAVVGGVVGGIAGVAIIAVLVFLLMNRRRNNMNAGTATGGATANYADKMAFEGPRAVAGNAGDGEKRPAVGSGGWREDEVDKRPAGASPGTRMGEIDKQPAHHV